MNETIVSRVFAVFTEIIQWFTTSMTTVSSMFYTTESGLTLFGTLAVIGLGISIVFLLVNVIKGMLRLQ